MIVSTGMIQFRPVKYPEAVATEAKNGLLVETEGSADKIPLTVLNINSISAETIVFLYCVCDARILSEKRTKGSRRSLAEATKKLIRHMRACRKTKGSRTLMM